MRRKIISIDLDGVLNTYCGNYNENIIPPPREGAVDFLEKLSENYYIEIFTARCVIIGEKWLRENNLMRFIVRITNLKNPLSTVMLDDRAINFNGDFKKAFDEIQNFKPHWKH